MERKPVDKMSRKELLALPERKWNEPSRYTSVTLVPTGRKHDSGYRLMAIIGARGGEAVEIAAYCDDIQWIVPEATTFGFRNDMFFGSRCVHFHSSQFDYCVGTATSTTEIYLTPRKK